MNDGLISNNINSICQDSLGFIWIATEEGLSRFDSQQFQNYSIGNGLRYDNIQLVTADKFDKGAVWVCYTDGGLAKYKNGKFYYPDGNLPAGKGNITAIFEDNDSTIWCGTNNSVFLIKDNSIYNFEKGREIAWVNTIEQDSAGNILIAASNGLFKFNKESRILTEEKGISKNFYKGIVSIYSGVKLTEWFLKSSGALIKQTGNKVEQINLKTGRTYFNITGSTDENFLYLSSDLGIIEIDKNNLLAQSEITERNGLPSNNVIYSMIDRDGILWLGNNNDGISKLVYRNLLKFNKDKYFTTSLVDNISHFWFTTGKGLLEIWKDKNNSWHKFTHVLTKYSQNPATNFIFYHNGKIILTYGYGIIDEYAILNKNPLSLNPSELRFLTSTDLKSKFKFSGLYKSFEDSYGNIWTSALDFGVIVLSNSKVRKVIKVYNDGNGLPDNSVRIIYEDSKENFWIGGYNHGLTFFSKDKVLKDLGMKYDTSNVQQVMFTKVSKLPDNFIRTVTEDSKHDLLIGTRYGGIAVLKNNNFINLSRTSGLISNGIWDIEDFGNFGIWVATQDGIQKLNKDFSNGSELNEEIPNIPFYSISANNNFVSFSGYREIYIYEPSWQKRHFRTSIYFNKILVNGKNYPLSTNPYLNSEQNNITFEFTRIDNIEDKNRIYNYRMVGIERSWNKLVNKNFVTYASLKPGKYTFQVNSFSSDNTLRSPVAFLTFEIEQPFYLEWWFFTGWILLFMISVFLFVNFKNKRKLEIEKIRMKIAEDLHDEIGSGLTKIAILSEQALKDHEEKIPAIGSNPALEKDNSIIRVGKIARDLVDQMIDVIWSIDPKYDSLNDFVFSFKNFAYELCEAKKINLVIKTENIENVKVNSQIKRNLQLIVKESLNNAIKYSECTEIIFALEVKNKNIFLSIKDNGKGFNKESITPGKGLINIRKNTTALSGKCSIISSPGVGTNIELTFPVLK